MSEHDADHQHGDITILAPNGFPLNEPYHPQQTVAITLDHAAKKFQAEHQLDPNVSADAYNLVLGETTLESSLTLAASGVTSGSVLKIRAKKIPSDGDAPGAF